ncbi:hypothetical protein [Falsirhodobacter sp. alg1]|uniref:hypothetical protein n=1 Tax=Falsirhodobacter sp. alg1 TaxID=1472418 RepID=UPI0005EF46A0|nr:hypothetical protein [Falsirhodobacter sp. alg1]
MFAQVLKQVGMAFRASARATAQTNSNTFFEVQLIGAPVAHHVYGAVPLTITTTRPLEVAGELMRDRDPSVWDVLIRPVQMRVN